MELPTIVGVEFGIVVADFLFRQNRQLAQIEAVDHILEPRPIGSEGFPVVWNFSHGMLQDPFKALLHPGSTLVLLPIL
jgi:hypothetical protein